VEPRVPDRVAASHVVGEPCPFLARAWWGDQIVAESRATVRVEEPGQPPGLYFPCADVRFDLFYDQGTRSTCPVKGAAQFWTVEVDAEVATSTHGVAEAGSSIGQGILRRFIDPPPELHWLSHLAVFDHDRVRIELIDAVEESEPRDATVKRFPTWGDASDLVGVLDVQRAGPHRYVSVARSDDRRPVVEGSQMLGQAIVAGGREAPGRRPVSAHMVFLRPADAGEPLQFDLEELSAGRTFTALAVRVMQSSRLCGAGTLLLDRTSSDLIRHEVPPPETAGPYDSEPYDMGVTGRDIRVVDGAYTDDPSAPTGPPVLDSWVKFRKVPDDACLHAGLLAQFTGHMSIAASLRPHDGYGQRQAHRTLSTAINAITIAFHRNVRVDRWALYRHVSTFAGDGMTHSECRVHNAAGELLASFTVEAMVRAFGAGHGDVDERTAL
jgi:acyl-CoA thioesterase II